VTAYPESWQYAVSNNNKGVEEQEVEATSVEGGRGNIPPLTEAQSSLWDALVSHLRAHPSEELLELLLFVSDFLVPSCWSNQFRADCYRARLGNTALPLYAVRQYAAARQWHTPRPLDHESALRLVTP
jgi:hypothetical protein